MLREENSTLGSPSPAEERGEGPAHRLRPLWVSMSVAFLAVVPFLLRGYTQGSDLWFHLASWLEVNRQWHEGIFYPRWAAWANYGVGEPRFVFYPPTSWMMGGALVGILPWRAAPGVFVWIGLTLAGISMYRLSREALGRDESLWAAALYATNPYMMFQIYYRAALAELLVGSIFPLEVLAALRVGRSDRRGFLPLALLTAAVWVTNAPGAVISTYSVALLLAVAAFRQRSARPLLAGGAAIALGIALAAFYVVPATYEQRWVNIAAALNKDLRLEDNVLFAVTDSPLFQRRNLVIYSIATVEMGLFAIALAGVRRVDVRARRTLVPLGILGILASLSLLRPSLFVWYALPWLKFVQFPWRGQFVLSVAMVLAVIAAAPHGVVGRVWRGLLICAWLCMAGLSWRYARWGPGELSRTVAAMQNGNGYRGAPEYTPLSSDWKWLASRATEETAAGGPLAGRSGSVLPGSDSSAVQVMEQKDSSEEHSFIVETPQPARLAIKLLSYPAWRLEVNGAPIAIESLPGKGLAVARLPGGRSRVRIFFARTPDRVAGAVVSAAAAVVLLGLLARRRRIREA